MPPIIQATDKFVNSRVSDEELAKPQEELSSQLLEIYQGLNIVFMGTPEFSVPILEALCQNDFTPKAVVTAPDKPVGRDKALTPSPIKLTAKKYGLPVFQPQTKEDLVSQVLNLKPDLIAVAAYGKILPKEILDLPKYGSLNVHPSLLPKYRGASPIQFAILNGEEKTGVTIMLMDEKMDEGPILAQETLEITADDTAQTLEKKLSFLSAKLLTKTLSQWLILKMMPKTAQGLVYPQEQDGSLATYTKILTKQDGKIFWNKTAKEIDYQIRAFIPWPGSFTFLRSADKDQAKSLMVKILQAHASETDARKELGEAFLINKQELAVQTTQGSLVIEQLQLEGGKAISASEFLNGHPEIIGVVLQ